MGDADPTDDPVVCEGPGCTTALDPLPSTVAHPGLGVTCCKWDCLERYISQTEGPDE